MLGHSVGCSFPGRQTTIFWVKVKMSSTASMLQMLSYRHYADIMHEMPTVRDGFIVCLQVCAGLHGDTSGRAEG